MNEALFIRTNILMKPNEMADLRNVILQQMKKGVVVLPAYCEAIYPIDIDAIRQEIADYKDDKVIHAERNEMIDIVLEIIDKHTKGAQE